MPMNALTRSFWSGLATKDSLILIDELGRWVFCTRHVCVCRFPNNCRGTSTIEGMGIAHAIAESLIDLGVSNHIGASLDIAETTLRRLIATLPRKICIPWSGGQLEQAISSHFHDLSVTLSRRSKVVKYAMLKQLKDALHAKIDELLASI